MSTPRNTPATGVKMMVALHSSALTYDELVTLSGLSKPVVSRWVKNMRDAKTVHVAEWRDDTRGRKFVPAFVWGDGDDVARPGAAQTPAQRMASTRARRRAGG